MPENMWPWVLFNVFVLVMLVLDLGVFHRHAHVVKVREALGFSALWIGLALCFNVFLFFWKGSDTAFQFLTGYVIEKSLSVDNLFVFIMIFSTFRVPAKYQHEVLFWGILGALVMRAIFIAAGVALLHHFHWIIYIFGGFLIYTGIKLASHKEVDVHPEKNPVLIFIRRFLPVSNDYEGGKFFVRHAGKLMATPLFIVLLTVEMTDVIFAMDSIPAILAITPDPFIVYTSNVFAILGLRALYFALAGIMKYFHYLNYGLCVILVFVGTKMVLADVYKIPTFVSLLAVVGVLLLSVAASLIWPKPKEDAEVEKIVRETGS